MVLIAILAVSAVPRRAQAIAPLLLAPEVWTVAGALLTAGGVAIYNDDASKKAITVAWDSFAESTKDRLQNSVGMEIVNWIWTQDDVDSVNNAKNAINQAAANQTTINYISALDSGSGTTDGDQVINLQNAQGQCDFDIPMACGEQKSIVAQFSLGSSYWWNGLQLFTDVHWTGGDTRTCHLHCRNFSGGVAQGEALTLATQDIVLPNLANFGTKHITMTADGGTGSIALDGVTIGTWEGIAGLELVYLSDNPYDPNNRLHLGYAYEISGSVAGTLNPGVDYDMDPAKDDKYVGGYVGSNTNINTGTGDATTTANTPTQTWPQTFDNSGIIGALGNIWSLLKSLLGNVIDWLKQIYAKLVAIAGAVATTPPSDYFNGPIDNLKTFIVGKVPTLPNLGTSGFGERQWNWTVTINHPITLTFEIINSELLNSQRNTIKGWTSGILIFLTTLYVYRKIPMIVKGA